MNNHFLIAWRDGRTGEVQTLKARSIRDSSLGLTFVAISDFVWATDSRIVNPADEALQRRFEHTKTLHVSIHTVLSIEEVGADHEGLVFEKDRSNLVVFPPNDRK